MEINFVYLVPSDSSSSCNPESAASDSKSLPILGKAESSDCDGVKYVPSFEYPKFFGKTYELDFSGNENFRKIHMRYVVVHFIDTIQE